MLSIQLISFLVLELRRKTKKERKKLVRLYFFNLTSGETFHKILFHICNIGRYCPILFH